MKIKNWIACVQDRGKWKEVVEKAETFNWEVQRLEEDNINLQMSTFFIFQLVFNFFLYANWLSARRF
jgi:hypothetical protein